MLHDTLFVCKYMIEWITNVTIYEILLHTNIKYVFFPKPLEKIVTYFFYFWKKLLN